ncbi:DUF6000 family protein [Actinoallomurus soli]|uniref:DUF6000 family protein n=1 Tax=Actinoallomurus soli TaxID=2952535 RepID=UPI002093C03C|nr:DUF6000 family protein [Actinoallomurus soli]MCO5971319.1 DUF6000 family protein [Actinoallomurus soli]
MPLPAPHESELRALERRYVSWSQTGPLRLRYLKIMGVNALRDGEPRRSLLVQSLAEDARQITDDELGLLLTSEWRARLTAAWLIGLDHRTQFRDRIGSLLRDGPLMKAGAGYSLALARFGQHSDAALLATCLERRLSMPEPFYEQHFVIGALLYLDERLGTDHARDMVRRSWRQPVTGQEVRERFRGYVKQLCAFADECMLRTSGEPE